MAKIFKNFTLKIDDVKLKLNTLSFEDKTEAQALIAKGYAKSDLKMLSEGFIYVVRRSVKSAEGLTNEDGSEYQLKFDDSGLLTDECISDLMNCDITDKLTMVCASLAGKVKNTFTDQNGNPIEGVELITNGEPSPKN